jgi:hypothetical protein
VIVTGLAASLGGLGLGVSALANATKGFQPVVVSTTPPAMKLTVSQGESVDKDGTQGSFKAAMDGTINTGDQCTSTSSTPISCDIQSRNADEGMHTAK